MELLAAVGLLALCALLATLVPSFLDAWARRLDRLLLRGRGGRWASGLAIAAFAGAALVALAAGAPVPRVHDEWSYLLAGDTFAHGRLANPSHPLWRHFEMVHVLVRPTYASKYPPGQGLALALGDLLGAPALGVWISGALFMAAAIWMLHGWLRPRAARLGALLLLLQVVVATPWSQGYWGGFVPALGGALLLGAVPRLARRARTVDGGAFGGGAAILLLSRPYEGGITGACALALLATWRLRRSAHESARDDAPKATDRWWRALLVALLCGVAAIAFLLYDDWRVTGDPLLLPYQLHDARFTPTPLFLWQHPRTPTEVPPEPLATFYRVFEARNWRAEHTLRGWLAVSELKVTELTLFYLGPVLLLLVLVLVWPRRSRRGRREPPRDARTVPSAARALRAATAVVLALLASQLVIVPSRPHYVAPGAVALAVMLATGWRRLAVMRWRGARFGRRMAALLPLALLALLPLRAAALRPPPEDWAVRRQQVQTALSLLPGPQLVLVSYGPAHEAQAEWMANGADLFGAHVLWARSLTPREDCQLLAVERRRRAWLLRVEEELSPPRLAPYPRSLCAGADASTAAAAAPKRTRLPSTDQGSTSSRRSASG